MIVVSPDDTGIASARAKTDKLDARTLAGLCWKGELEAVWMPDRALSDLAPPARAPRAARARTLAREERDLKRCCSADSSSGHRSRTCSA